MLEFKLAWQSLKKNKQLYLPFILVTTILIGIYYIFQAIYTNNQLLSSTLGEGIKSLMNVAIVFIGIIIVIFMFYINNVLAKRRNRELGLYSMLGMTKKNLFMIVLFIDIIMFAISLILGSIVGMIFVKLSVYGFVKLLYIKMIQFSILNITALSKTIVFFGVIFLLLLLLDLIMLGKVRPVELWNSTNKGEKAPKHAWLTTVAGLVGIAMLAVGYYISSTIKPSVMAIVSFMLAVILVVLGTYIIFTAGSILLLRILQKNRKYYYKQNHFITISGMIYRMKQNGVGLASICLLCTASMVALVATSSLMIGKNAIVNGTSPLDVVILQNNSQKNVNSEINKLAQKYDVKHYNYKILRSTPVMYGKLVNNSVSFQERATTQTTLQISATPLSDYNKTQGTNYHLKDNEILIYSPNERYRNKEIKFNGRVYNVRSIDEFKYNLGNNSVITAYYIIAKTPKIAEDITKTKLNKNIAFNTSGTYKNRYKFAEELGKQLQKKGKAINVINKLSIQDVYNQFFGGFMFIGIVISLVMLLTTVMVMYYKQISEGYADRNRFKTMKQVGLSKNETRQVINSQVLLVFISPIIMAVIHLGFSLPALRSILMMFSMYDLSRLLIIK